MYNIVYILKKVEMVGFDIQNDGELGEKLEKATVILARLGDKNILAADSEIAADGVKLAADGDGGVLACVEKYLRYHAGGACFSVSAGYGDGVIVAFHDRSQKLGAVDKGDALFFSPDELRVIFFDGCRVYDEILVGYIFGAVTYIDRGSAFFKIVGDVGAAHIRAGDGAAVVYENAGESAHADAAYADKMYFEAGYK